tara:strand:- start:91 stop:957 length:867 start_codon:yes stop_codon:yes gene_type:complete
MKILILGASGMLGSAITNILSEMQNWTILGTVRSNNSKNLFNPKIAQNLIKINDLTNTENLIKVLHKAKPDIVINCISLDRELLKKGNPIKMISTYSLLPHQLSKVCKEIRARLIQISTDGVFSGKKGNYKEDDIKDSQDIYGASKYLGELNDEHTITIRTSIIGHELSGKNGLVEWFLSQKTKCECFECAIFTGFPTVVLAEIIRDIIIPNKKLKGIYHIASKPITKCKLLALIAKEYGLKINLIINKKIKIDRSLNADRFKKATGYVSPNWKNLIKSMYLYNKRFQ